MGFDVDAILAVHEIRDGIEGMMSETGDFPDRYWKRSVKRDLRKPPQMMDLKVLANHLDELVDGLEGVWQETGDISRYWRRNTLRMSRKALKALRGLSRRPVASLQPLRSRRDYGEDDTEEKMAMEILAVAREIVAGSLPKIPGVSAGRLNKFLDEIRDNVTSNVSDSYHGAGWVAKWRVDEVDELDRVSKASFIEAWGSEDDEMVGSISSYNLRADEDTYRVINVAIARALKGSYRDKASFSWTQESVEFSLPGPRGVKAKVGDIFESEGDSFYRGLYPPDHVVEADIVVKVKRSVYKKRDEEIVVSAEFKTV